MWLAAGQWKSNGFQKKMLTGMNVCKTESSKGNTQALPGVSDLNRYPRRRILGHAKVCARKRRCLGHQLLN